MISGRFEPSYSAASFTELKIERLHRGLNAIPSHRAGGIRAVGVERALSPQVGGTPVDIAEILGVLRVLSLIQQRGEVLGRTVEGDRVRRLVRNGASHELVLAILRSGLMSDQIRKLQTVLVLDGDEYRCSRSSAVALAPQLIGILARMPEVSVGGSIRLGQVISLEIDSAWNEMLILPGLKLRNTEAERKEVGDRAELYTVHLERTAFVGATTKVLWVSRDDDALGYDVEVAGSPKRRIEVKGSRGPEVRFTLSANEYDKSRKHGPEYEIHFWGTIALDSVPAVEYERLRAAGYPIVLSNPSQQLQSAPWHIEPSEYRVRRD